jgi:hypothetical protein
MEDIKLSTNSSESLEPVLADLLRDENCPITNRVCILAQMESGVRNWLFQLEKEKRLNIALKAFKAIDDQAKVGAQVEHIVSQALKEIDSGFGNVKDGINNVLKNVKAEMDESIKEYLRNLMDQTKTSREETEKFIKGIVEQQVSNLIGKVDLLLRQGKGIEEIQRELKDDIKKFVGEIVEEQVKLLVGKVEMLLRQSKAIDEIEKQLKEAVGGLNTILERFKVPTVKGEEKELELLKMINEAFLGNQNVVLEPIGGPDATDAIVIFRHQDLEIGRVLIESKAAKTWKNEFLEQVKSDMSRYNIATAILATETLPRSAKVKGYTIDDNLGIIVITTPEMAVPTVAMFYDIYACSYRFGKTMDLKAILEKKDIVHYVEDNLNCLDDCKKIIDCIGDANEKIEKYVKNIMNRIKQNNEKIIEILSQYGEINKA